MTEEQVREAVKQGIETLKPKAMSAAKDVFNTVLDAYSQGFWEGVGIAINCLWHEADEEPKKGKPIATLTIHNDFIAGYGIADGGMTWEEVKKFDDVVKWLYVEDILPKGK